MPHAPRLAEQWRGIDAAGSACEQLIEGCLRLARRQFATQLQAPQGGSALGVDVAGNRDFGVQDMAG